MASELKESKKAYFQEHFHSNIGNTKLLWKRIKLIINKDSQADAINILKDTAGKSITDSETMATIFKDSLVYVANSINHKIPR